MQQKSIDISKKGANTILAKKMIENGSLSFLINEDMKKRTETARTRIENHRKTESAENIEGKWLKAYCDYFKCSADYLFGFIATPTHVKTDVHDKTGLSAEAIEQLIEWHEKSKLPDNNFYRISILFISDLLECCGIQAAALAQNVSNYLFYRKVSETENLTSQITKGIYDKYEVARTRASYKFLDCLEYIYKHSKNVPTKELLQTCYPKTNEEKYLDDILGL